MSKYEPLKHHLAARRGAEAPMTFADVEAILGFPLPASARSYPAWWANNTGTHVNAAAWRDAGWKTSRVDLGSERVTFVRENDTRDATPVGSSGHILLPLEGLSRIALQMIDERALSDGLDRAAAAAALIESAARGRKRQFLDGLSIARMPPGHDSTAMIREDRDGH